MLPLNCTIDRQFLYRINAGKQKKKRKIFGLAQVKFFIGYSLSPLQKHVRKVVGGAGKKSFVSTGVRKPGNTCASPTAMI